MPDPTSTSRLLTLVFTDLANSTALKTQRGDSAVGELIRRHRELITRLADECSGRIIDWAGDGCFLTFEVSSAGVLFALRLQQAHAEQPDLPQVRVGIHLGEVTERAMPSGGVRVEGLAVDMAARIGGLARPGQVLMSSAVYHSARQRLGVETLGKPVLWQTHGAYTFKGFEEPLDISEAALEGIARPLAPEAGEKAQPARKPRRRDRGSRWTPRRITFLIIIVVLIIASRFPESAPPKRDEPASTSPSSPPPASATSTAPAEAEAPIRSLAVLPLDDFSSGAKEDYFADGMTEAIISELAKIRNIKVISRTSVMRYKGAKDKSMQAIARDLGVDSIIEGSVIRDGNQVRVTAQLIRGATDEHLWADAFTNTMDNVLQLQSKVALEIASRISAVVTPQEAARFAAARPVNPEAYSLYLQGRAFWNQRTPEGLAQAQNIFAQAIKLDPDFASAHVGLADALIIVAQTTASPARDAAVTRARDEVKKALELNPQLGEAYASQGLLYSSFDWDWTAAEDALRRSIELSPGYASAHQWYGVFLLTVGRHDEAVIELRKAQELDPASPAVVAWLSLALATADGGKEAVELLQTALKMYPGNSRLIEAMVQVLVANQRYDEALRFAEDVPTDSRSALTKATLLARTGRAGEARTLLTETLGRADGRSYPMLTGIVYLALGDSDTAFEWFERGYRERDYLMSLIKSPLFHPFINDPRYKDLLRRMNLPE